MPMRGPVITLTSPCPGLISNGLEARLMLLFACVMPSTFGFHNAATHAVHLQRGSDEFARHLF